MFFLSLAAVFALGAVVASFIGVVAVRLYTGQGFLTGRSRCDACGAPLQAVSLVPIFAYIASRGRAQCCGTRISFIAPVSEVFLGSLFVLAYLKLGLASALPFMLVSLSALLSLVLYDLAHQILPTPLLASFVAAAAITGFLSAPSLAEFRGMVLAAFFIAAFLAAIHYLSRGRAMGFADAPFAFGCALLAGPTALSGFVFSFWIGAIIGIALLAGRPRGSRIGVEVPFAPFLAAGFLLAYFTQWNIITLLAASLPSK
jgi:prepilin signal peptidase PulO-like enzyme (type II secretory pathway)